MRRSSQNRSRALLAVGAATAAIVLSGPSAQGAPIALPTGATLGLPAGVIAGVAEAEPALIPQGARWTDWDQNTLTPEWG